jgi:hypothetical protein
MFHGSSYAATKGRRLERIRDRACPELIQAYETGQLPLRQFDLLSQLPWRQQRRTIAARERERRATVIAATVITEILDGTREIRLADVAREIAARLARQDAP